MLLPRLRTLVCRPQQNPQQLTGSGVLSPATRCARTTMALPRYSAPGRNFHPPSGRRLSGSSRQLGIRAHSARTASFRASASCRATWSSELCHGEVSAHCADPVPTFGHPVVIPALVRPAGRVDQTSIGHGGNDGGRSVHAPLKPIGQSQSTAACRSSVAPRPRPTDWFHLYSNRSGQAFRSSLGRNASISASENVISSCFCNASCALP